MRRLGCQKCGFIACICGYVAAHKEGCRFLGAVQCPVGIECEHGRDVCPICDPCTCMPGALPDLPKEATT